MAREIRALIVFFFLLSSIAGAHAAAVHGSIYTWSDFEKPLKNAIIEINSTPVQSKVATDGTYSFENLPPGNYSIVAKYYRNNMLEYTTEEEIKIIDREGNFNIDLLLFPPTEPESEYLADINLTSQMDTAAGDNDIIYIMLAIVALAAFGIYYYIHYIRGRKAPIEPARDTAPQPDASTGTRIIELPPELRDLYNLIIKTGGRTTQKELRKRLSYSEASVSLMLDDLESRGLIKKIKKGRSNIIIANQKN